MPDDLCEAPRFAVEGLTVIFVDLIAIVHQRPGVSDELPSDQAGIAAMHGIAEHAFDRVLATRFGLHAIDAVHDGDFGVMVALRGTDIVRVPLSEATKELKTVPPERLNEVEVFFGS